MNQIQINQGDKNALHLLVLIKYLLKNNMSFIICKNNTWYSKLIKDNYKVHDCIMLYIQTLKKFKGREKFIEVKTQCERHLNKHIEERA